MRYSNPAHTVIATDDGRSIPCNPANSDYADILRAGIVPDAYVAPSVTGAEVDAERDRRMGTFSFGGKAYDLKGQSLANVSGAGTLSLAALINGAQPGDLRWADPDSDFSWIANDNTLTLMDAQTCWAFAQTAASHRKAMIFKARALKDMNPIPSDYTADSHWE